LQSGRIKLARISPDGHEKVIDLISPGNPFAKTIMFSGEIPAVLPASIDQKHP